MSATLLTLTLTINYRTILLIMLFFTSWCKQTHLERYVSMPLVLSLLLPNKGAYIKYVRAGGEGSGGFCIFLKKKFAAQETIDLNFSWPSNFFRIYFMVHPINFSFLFKVYLQQYFSVVFKVILKFQITEEVNIRSNIQKIIFK